MRCVRCSGRASCSPDFPSARPRCRGWSRRPSRGPRPPAKALPTISEAFAISPSCTETSAPRYPEGAGGLVTSGGLAAALDALVAAREAAGSRQLPRSCLAAPAGFPQRRGTDQRNSPLVAGLVEEIYPRRVGNCSRGSRERSFQPCRRHISKNIADDMPGEYRRFNPTPLAESGHNRKPDAEHLDLVRLGPLGELVHRSDLSPAEQRSRIGLRTLVHLPRKSSGPGRSDPGCAPTRWPSSTRQLDQSADFRRRSFCWSKNLSLPAQHACFSSASAQSEVSSRMICRYRAMLCRHV